MKGHLEVPHNEVLAALRLWIKLIVIGYCANASFAYAQVQVATPDLSFVDARICQHLTNSNAPSVQQSDCTGSNHQWGGSFAIAKDGKIIYEKGFGAADFSGSAIVEPYHMFRNASIHKAITAIGIMRLYQDGELTLNQKVFGATGIINDAYFNEAISPGSAVLDITVDHLLRHSSGWASSTSYTPFDIYNISKNLGEVNRASLDTLIKYMVAQEPVYTPGTTYSYNNMNFLILNKVIEKVSGQSYAEYFRDNIFDPLDITEIKPAKTFYGDKYDNEVDYLWASLTESTNQYPSYCTGEDVPSQYGFFRHEGTWISSARGLIQLFLAIDKENGGQHILSSSVIDDMFTAIALDNVDTTDPYDTKNVARGWGDVSLTNGNEGDWAHSGGMAGSQAFFQKTDDGYMLALLQNASPNENESMGTSPWEELYEPINDILLDFRTDLDGYEPGVFQAEHQSCCSSLVDDFYSGAEGGEYVSWNQGIGDSITFEVNSPLETTADLVLRYANGGSNYSIKVVVNGQDATSSTSLDATGSWSTWQDKTFLNISLEEGTNSVVIYSLASSGTINYDELAVTLDDQVQPDPEDTQWKDDKISTADFLAGCHSYLLRIPTSIVVTN